MTVPPTALFSEEEARALYERLLAEDPVAPSDLAVTYLERLTTWLIAHNPRVHPNDCATAAGDAILALIKNPKTYKPGRQTLEVYLRMSASGDLKNLLGSERRHREHRADWQAVAHSPVARKYLEDTGADPARILEQREDEALMAVRSSPGAESLRAGLTPEEARVIELMQMRERKTALYAAALGISDLAFQEQQREVKRVKDRLKKRLKRAGGSDG